MSMPSQPIKLLAIDVDGTLLDSHKHITPRTLEAVQAAKSAGVTVTLATARRYYNSAQIADELGIEIPLVTHDGALIIHHPDGHVLHTHPLAEEIAQQAVEIIARYGVQPVVQLVTGNVEETWSGHPEFDNQELRPYFVAFPDVHRRQHAELCLGQPNIMRVVAFSSQEVITQMFPEFAALDCLCYTIARGNYECAELVAMHKECSKASGVKMLAQMLNIPLAQIMAIGDNINDLEMLREAGWGVAMGHAPESVKAVAQAVTASNNEDGVALAIERYILFQYPLYGAKNSSVEPGLPPPFSIQ